MTQQTLTLITLLITTLLCSCQTHRQHTSALSESTSDSTNTITVTAKADNNITDSTSNTASFAADSITILLCNDTILPSPESMRMTIHKPILSTNLTITRQNSRHYSDSTIKSQQSTHTSQSAATASITQQNASQCPIIPLILTSIFASVLTTVLISKLKSRQSC